MRIAFHPEALDEYEQAARYYASRQQGLGQRFVLAIESAVRKAAEDPLRFRFFEQDIRRVLAKVFPYAVLFTVEEDHILVVAVMHCHREPGYWKSRTPDDQAP